MRSGWVAGQQAQAGDLVVLPLQPAEVPQGELRGQPGARWRAHLEVLGGAEETCEPHLRFLLRWMGEAWVVRSWCVCSGD